MPDSQESSGPIIFTLHISKEEPGLYLAQVLESDTELFDFSAPTIASAIREAATDTGDVTAWHIWYGHVSIGTTLPVTMKHESEDLAQRLVRLHGQVR